MASYIPVLPAVPQHAAPSRCRHPQSLRPRHLRRQNPTTDYFRPTHRRYTAISSLPTDDGSTTPPVLLTRLANAFIDACQPGRRSYTAALHDFCSTALDAYRRGYSLTALDLELAATSTASAVDGRPLLRDEVELRSVWLSLVFKTLRHIGFPTLSSSSSATEDNDAMEANKSRSGFLPPDRMDVFVGNIVRAVRDGYDMNRIRLEQSMFNDDRPRTELESAILGQSTRLVITTITAADDALRDQVDQPSAD